jgi:hypothetical protein
LTRLGLAAAIAVVVVLLAILAGHAGRQSHDAAFRASRRAPHKVAAHPFRTFYVSYTSGSETNSGTSAGSAWQRAPGMRGFSASYSHRAGDHFVFEGGVRWPNGALPLIAVGSGEPGNEDYYGVDRSWYAGAKYEAPVFDAEGRRTEGVDPLSGIPVDDMIWMNQLDYITVEGIHFENWTATKLPSGVECGGIALNNGGDGGDTHINLNGIGFTGWSADYESTELHGDNCVAVESRGTPADTSLTNSTIEGKEGEAYGWSVRCISRVENDEIGKAVDLVTPCPDTGSPKVAVVANNKLFDCGYPKWPPGAQGNIHGDAIQSSDGPPSTGETDYIHGNVIYNTGYTGEGVYGGAGGDEGECESSLLGGEVGTHLVTDYLWNNVYYNIHGNSPSTDGSSASFYAWNNTIEGGETGHEPCLNGPAHGGTLIELVWKDNLCISDGEDLIEGVARTQKESGTAFSHHNNLVLTKAEFTADRRRCPNYRLPGALRHCVSRHR